MVFQKKNNRLLQVLTISSVLALAGCGDSSDDSDSSSSTTISGSIFASHVKGASVSVYDENDQVIAGPVTTNNMGRYSISIANADVNNRLRFVSSGGTYTDEATGDTLVEASELAVYVAAGEWSVGDEVHATPGSTIMHRLRHQHALSKSLAENAFEMAFDYLPDSTIEPLDSRNSGMDTTTESLAAGLRAARFSQLTADLSLTPTQQFAMLEALARDLSDGVFDGVDTGGAVELPDFSDMPTDIATRFGRTGENFGIGVKRSENYRFTYQPGMMASMEGKTMFKVAVTDLATGLAPQSGLALTISAKMFMATKIHATPVDGCSASSTPGTYDCKIFYLMPTAMMGSHKGDWELAISAGTVADTVRFYPPVGMGMNGNGKKKLTAQQTGTTTVDELEVPIFSDYMMMPTKARPYFMFKNAITGATDARAVSIFAAMQQSMMSFPALVTGNIELAFSTDGSSWDVMSDDGNGYWSIDALSDAEAAKFYVRLTVNGEVKINGGITNNFGSCEVSDVIGNEVPLCNGYATFEQTLP